MGLQAIRVQDLTTIVDGEFTTKLTIVIGKSRIKADSKLLHGWDVRIMPCQTLKAFIFAELSSAFPFGRSNASPRLCAIVLVRCVNGGRQNSV